MADNAILRRLASLQDNGRFNADYEDSLSAVLRRLIESQSGADMSRSRLGEDFGRATSDLTRQFSESQDALQARMADQGILRSGINIGEQGRQAAGYTRAQDLLNLTNRRGLEDIDRTQTSNESQINDYISQLQRDKARQDMTGALGDAQRDAQTQADQTSTGQYNDQINRSLGQIDSAEQAYNQQVASLQPVLTPTGQYAYPPQSIPQPIPNPVGAAAPSPAQTAVSRRLTTLKSPTKTPTTAQANDSDYLMRYRRAF